ncbi:N-acetylmuramoyl-L-alanine amidase [Roseofilum casamattae]|uniref:N-acetylmuramoyl-L-alanine amidase n=1 Tax=Roseofilum casamattae BLCC-M143 TaxID=3022442 RepID=A0ABT7C320_9CYAN|nr:N-acetylmuramoyl-L-alanine amidase [Roseofilum casamattae]MDJ1185829.1 N-acetylmuramoyl-L-alanine amidase [Roseofilum casamattae BLCC-M143]
MKLHWLFPSLLGLWLWSVPVQAASLQYWRFDARTNRLEFATNGRVQPRAELVFNPTRLVIDLPGVTLGNQLRSQLVSSPGIRQVRTGQFNRNTTRLVIELAPGYTIDPNQVKFRGASPSRWTVEIPQPQREGTVSRPPARSPSPTPRTPVPSPSPAPRPAASSGPQIEGVRITGDGFFLRTSDRVQRINRVRRSRNKRKIEIEIEGVSIASSLTERQIQVNSRGVQRLTLSPLEGSTSGTLITLDVDRKTADWQALTSRLGIVMIPKAGTGRTRNNSEPWPTGREIGARNATRDPSLPAAISALELSPDNSQLLIRSTGRINAVGQWNGPAVYNLTLSPAQLSEGVVPVAVGGNSPFVRFDVQQTDSQTVVISMLPRSGFTLQNTSQSGSQIAWSLGNSGTLLPPIATQPLPSPSPSPSSSTIRIPVPPPANPQPSNPQPATRWPLPPNTRRTPNSRIVVVIDPGHGGRDPGAVGIGGLRETDVVLDISRQVAAILQQNGIQVALTRNYEVEVDLAPRVAYAERVNATLFVSIHANAISLSRPDVNGAETYYYNSGARLAQSIQQSILQSLPMRDRGVKRARFYVLRRTSMPSVLVETGFVTGAQDAPRLANPTFRSQMAQAIANGILRYVQQNY